MVCLGVRMLCVYWKQHGFVTYPLVGPGFFFAAALFFIQKAQGIAGHFHAVKAGGIGRKGSHHGGSETPKEGRDSLGAHQVAQNLTRRQGPRGRLLA